MIDLLQWRSTIGSYHAAQCCFIRRRQRRSKLSVEKAGSVGCCLALVLLALLPLTLLPLAGDVENNPGPPKITGGERAGMARRVFQHYFAQVSEAIHSSTDTIARKLYSNKLISGELMDDVLTTTGLSSSHKSSRLMCAVRSTLNCASSDKPFQSFCQVLKSCGQSKGLAIKMTKRFEYLCSNDGHSLDESSDDDSCDTEKADITNDTLASLSTCYELTCELDDISDQWIQLGKHLNIPSEIIKKIELDTARVERRKTKLFQYWVENEAQPTWQKMVDALEEIGEEGLAAKLAQKHITNVRNEAATSQPVKAERDLKAITGNSALVQMENAAVSPLECGEGNRVLEVTDRDDIARKVNDIEDEFLKLESGILAAVEKEFPFSRLRQVAHKMTGEDFSECSTFYDIFIILEQHYSFLRIRILEKLNNIALNGSMSAEITKYTEDLEKFKNSHTIKMFMEIISTKAKPVTSNNKFQVVTLRLIEWERMTIQNLEHLLRYLFKDDADLFNHIRIEQGSVHVSWLVPSAIAPAILSQVEEKKLFLHQIGVERAQVGKHEVVTYHDGVPVAMDGTVANFPTLLLNASEDGCTEIVEFLLQSGVNVNYSDQEGWSALLVASKSKQLPVAELLLHGKANINHQNKAGDTAVLMASENGDVAMLKLCLEHNADCNITNTTQSTPLIETVTKFDLECTCILLQAGVDVNYANSSGVTALMIASQLGNTEVVKRLLDSNADPALHDVSGSTALTKACEQGNVDIVDLLFKAGANPTELDKAGKTAIHAACECGHYGVVAYLLLEASADRNSCDGTGQTLLYLASANGHPDIVELLLQANANPNLTDTTIGATALHVASIGGHADIVDTLLNAGADPNLKTTSDGSTPLHVAAEYNHIEVVKVLLNYSSVNVNAQYSEFQHTALHVAASTGCNEIVALLLAANADLNISAVDGRTALIAASLNGHSGIVELLLQAKANPNLTVTSVGATALYVASIGDHADIVDTLLRAGADPNLKTSQGFTPLKVAVRKNHTEVLKVLLNSSSVNVNAQDNKFQTTVLHLAAASGFSEIVTLLLTANADPNIPDEDGITALMYASIMGNSGVVELLLQVKANPNLADTATGSTALHYASENGHAQVTDVLLKFGANPCIKTIDKGATPLHMASEKNHTEVVRALLKSPFVDVNAQDSTLNQYTALHVACYYGHVDTVKSLLDAKANPNIVSDSGHSPLSLATQQGHTHIMNMLLCKNASPELSTGVRSIDLAKPEPYTDESKPETESEKLLEPDISSQVTTAEEAPFETALGTIRTLDYQPVPIIDNRTQYANDLLSRHINSLYKKESYIYGEIEADKKPSEQTSNPSE